MAVNERFLVTGATGFVGTCLTRRLVADGFETHVLARLESQWWRLDDLRRRLYVHLADLCDADAVKKTVAAIQPTVIYHLAVYGAYPRQTDQKRIMMTNVFGTLNLLNASRDVDYRVFVNTGSSSEYGFKSHPMKETDLLEPNTQYGVAKAAQTLLCRYFAIAEGRPICTLRLFSVYGPYEDPGRLFPTILRRALKGDPIDMAAPDVAHDFVYVDDVVQAYLRVEDLSRAGGKIFNIGSGVQSTLADVGEVVRRAVTADVKVNWHGMESRAQDTKAWVADTTCAKRGLGWSARTSLAEGVARTLDWVRTRGGECGEIDDR